MGHSALGTSSTWVETRRGLRVSPTTLGNMTAESPSNTPPRVLTPRRAEPAASVRPTRAEIGLGALRHNLVALSRAAGVPIWSVLKADAYGHGAKAVARTLERAG